MNSVRCVQCGCFNPPGVTACKRCGAQLQIPEAQASGPPPADAARVAFRAGQVVANRYRVIELIGQGGMGAIYRVHDNVLNEQVALKTLLPQFTRDKVVVERFFNEARIARQLSHPNIVRVHDIGTAGQVMYISMEYLKGRSLRAVLDHLPPAQRLPIVQVLAMMDQLCAALAYAHRYTVHRDLKPENVMIAEDGCVKLMDFGISKLMDHTRLTMTSIVMGTPQYMSPEQFRDSGSVDARADIYSLGVVLYEVLTGNPPTGMSKPVSQIMAEVPPSLDPIVAKCLEARPENRYGGAQQLREDLGRIRRLVEAGTDMPAPPDAQQRGGAGTLVRRAAGLVLAGVIAVAAGFGSWRLVAGTGPSGTNPDAPGFVQTPSEPPGNAESGTHARFAQVVELMERLRPLAEEQAGQSSESRHVLEMAEHDRDRVAQLDRDDPSALRIAESALQCYLGILLRPADDSMAFIPPGRVRLEDGSGREECYVNGFFIDRTEVTGAMFLDFAAYLPEGWHQLPFAPPNQPIVSIPHYYAQAFAAGYAHAFRSDYAEAFSAWREPVERQGKKLPSEAQWARAAEYANNEGADIAGMGNEIHEWTRSAFEALPRDPGENREDPDGLWFGVRIVVCGVMYEPDSDSPVTFRHPMPFESGGPNVGFRCVKELPASLGAIAAALQ